MSFGDQLRNAREQLGYSLDYIEEETKIRKYYIYALENENFDQLPPKVYAIGFVKKYVRMLQLDERAMVEEFQRLAYGSTTQEPEYSVKEEPLNTGRRRKRSVLFIVILMVIVILLVKIAASYLPDYSDVQMNPEHNVSQPSAQETDPNPEPQVAPETRTDVTLTLTAAGLCWTKVVVDGQDQYEGMMAAGESRSFTGQSSINLKLGNSGEMEVKINDKVLPPLGAQGVVAEKDFLAGETY